MQKKESPHEGGHESDCGGNSTTSHTELSLEQQAQRRTQWRRKTAGNGEIPADRLFMLFRDSAKPCLNDPQALNEVIAQFASTHKRSVEQVRQWAHDIQQEFKLPPEDGNGHDQAPPDYSDYPEAQGQTRDRSAGARPDNGPGQTRPRPDTGKSNILHVSAILDRQPSGNQLIKGWMGTGEFALLFGESGSFKTLIALEMVIAIVLGQNWRGHKVTQGAVLYVAGEGGGYGLTKRLQAYQIAHQVSLKDAPLFIREAPTLLPADTTALIEEIHTALDGTGLELVLVVLDTLNRTMQGNENSAEDFASYQQALDCLKHHFGCARMVLSHVGHIEKGRPKGTYQLISNPDCLLQTSADTSLEPQQRISQLISTKQKDAELPKPKAFKLAVVDLGYTDDEGDAVTGVALIEVQDYQPAAPPKPLGANEKLLLSILHSRGPMLEGDLRRVFVNTLEQLKPGQAYNTNRMAWVRAYGALKTDERITVDDTFIVRLPA